ncbi:CLUMA_CG010714, isoform A [Clunio marinus]|uniref:CLUMA_CG010714, isoform A n=1 Tax=Clunio marinus TaxID=568069 RepID=A0A1J1IAP5_9DIPT|nr:CLUMA_CG010714, isoform A [Clunio marinus]
MQEFFCCCLLPMRSVPTTSSIAPVRRQTKVLFNVPFRRRVRFILFSFCYKLANTLSDEYLFALRFVGHPEASSNQRRAYVCAFHFS